MDFQDLSSQQLIAFYNRHAASPVKRFSDRKAAIRRCEALFKSLQMHDNVMVVRQKAEAGSRPTMQTSLKLDRTITCVETGGVWRNAYRMWIENPSWMTSGQQDRLTAQLYAAAKRGERLEIKINGRTFYLVNV